MKLIGVLPPGSDRALRDLLPGDCEVVVVDDAAKLTDAEIAGAQTVIATAYTPLNGDAIARLKHVKLIQQLGIGTDTIDLETAKAHGIPVANVPTANVDAVADYTLMAMIYCLRKIAASDAATRESKRIDRLILKLGSYDMPGKQLGLVGFGNIGRAVAKRARAFDMTIVYADPRPADPQDEKELGARRIELSELLATSDIISLHVPLIDSTRNLINRETIATMKPKAVLINAARGGVVDEHALAEALQEGKIGAAAVDAFEIEPIDPGNPLLKAPNTLLTCHIAGVTNDCIRQMYEQSVQNCLRVMRGEQPINRVC